MSRLTITLAVAALMTVPTSVRADEEAAGEDANTNVVDASAPVEVVQERYPGGAVKVRREVTLDMAGNYINHGSWAMFDTSENEVAAGDFKNNQRDGQWSRTYQWGDSPLFNQHPYSSFEAPFTSKAEFDNGELNGKWTITDNQGRVASEWNYKEGNLDGTAKWMFPSGDPMEEIEYVGGLIDGTHKMWSEAGELLQDDTYQDGRKLAAKTETYASGAPLWEGMFLHEKHVMLRTDDWWKAVPVSYQPVGSAERHGRFTSWYENGEKKFEGLFENDVRAGEFKWWYSNTQLAAKGAYKDNERHGLWVWWHENGQKAIQGQYENGSLKGEWSYWASNGKLERKVNYDGDPEPVALHPVPSTDIPVIADTRTKRSAAAAK